MNYSNADSRLSGKFIVPDDRLELIRELEKEVVAARLRKKEETMRRKRKSS